MSMRLSLFSTPSLTVEATQCAVEHVDGRFVRVLGPGRHAHVARATHRVVSLLERISTTAPQEVLTADHAAVRVTVAVRWVVADARAYLERAADPFAAVYLAVQLALRDAVVETPVDDVARVARTELGAALVEAARTAGAPVGVEVRGVVVKDVLLPHELRAAHAEVLTAQARGRAVLEAARAETAALRSLANGAKLLDDHPALARLRLVQALPPGAHVEIVTPAE